MQRIVERSVRYACGICHAEYRTARQALACEASGREEIPSHLRRGAHVLALPTRRCSGSNKPYVCDGRVVGSIIETFDPEVHTKGFGITHKSKHIRMYKVRYRCPVCQVMKTALYPAACLKAY